MDAFLSAYFYSQIENYLNLIKYLLVYLQLRQ